MADKTKPFQAAPMDSLHNLLYWAPWHEGHNVSSEVCSHCKIAFNDAVECFIHCCLNSSGFWNIARSESLNHIEAELILLTFGLTRKTAGKLWIGVPLHNAYIPTSYYSPRSTFVLSKVQHTSPYLPLRQDQPPTRQDTKHLPTHQHLTTPSKPNISLPPPSQDAKLWCNGLALHRK